MRHAPRIDPKHGIRLLETIALKGMVVTAGALNCQRTIAAKVIEKGGDYVLALKANQGTLFDDVRLYLDDPAHAQTLSAEPPLTPWPSSCDQRACLQRLA